MNRLLSKYNSIAEELVQKEIERNDKVLAIGVCTSLASEDVWVGSDIDFLVISEDIETKQFKGETFKGVAVNWHYFGKEFVTNLLDGYPQSFTERRLPNLLYETRILYDPANSLKEASNFARKCRFSTEVAHFRAQTLITRGKNELINCNETFKKGEYIPSLLYARQVSFYVAASLLELNRILFQKRRFLSQLKNSAETLGKPELYSLYLKARRLENIDKDKALEIVSSFQKIVETLLPFVEKELHNTNNEKVKQEIQTFLSRNKIFYPYFAKGLEELYEKKRFIELVRLADLEVTFRISSIILNLNPNLQSKEYVIHANKHPTDFIVHYRKVMRLESIEEGNVHKVKDISEKILKEIENLETYLNTNST